MLVFSCPRITKEGEPMKVGTTQVALTHNGRHYSGLFSVSGPTLIIRVPGLGSRARPVQDGDDPMAVAKQLLQDIVIEAERSGLRA
jgi:hypothetical protein